MKNIRKLFIVLLISLFVLTSCGKKEEKKPEEVVVEVPKEATGYFYEKVAGRGILNIANVKKDGSTDIVLDWGSSASETAHWEMLGKYNPKNSSFEYTDGKYAIRTYDASGKYTESVIYEDGSGSFEFKDNSIIWHNNKNDEGTNDTVFLTDQAREEVEAELVNPWIETTDLNVAIKNAGVEFESPSKDLLPSGVKLKTYISAPEVISALYETKDGEMMLRKSYYVSGKELAGDYNKYSKAWSSNIRGNEVYFEGDGELANLAYYEGEDGYYTISYNSGKEGKGLNEDQITNLIVGMEAKPTLK